MANDPNLTSFAEEYDLPRGLKFWIFFFPIVVLGGFAVAMSIDSIQDYAFGLVDENALVDYLTWIPAFFGSVLGARLALRERKRGRETMIWLFYLVFAAGLFFIAGEETSWGQDFFHFQSPALFQKWNAQGDLTLHNLDGWNGKNHFLRIGFGVGGLIGLLLWKSQRLRDLAPPRVLQVWFWLIIGKSLLDIHFGPIMSDTVPAYIIGQLSEVIEMLVAIAGLLYVWLNGRRLGRSAR
jgi:hypothetical protein